MKNALVSTSSALSIWEKLAEHLNCFVATMWCPTAYASTTLSNKWKSALVVHSSLVEDPTIQQPGFDLPRRYLALLNCFRTNQGQCASCQKMSGLAATDMCQTTSHIVNSCPQTKLEGGLQRMHSADDVATEWLNAFDSNNNFQTFLTTHRI